MNIIRIFLVNINNLRNIFNICRFNITLHIFALFISMETRKCRYVFYNAYTYKIYDPI